MEKNISQKVKSSGSGEIITIGIGSSGVESTAKFFNDIAIEHDIIQSGKKMTAIPENFKFIDFSLKFFHERSSNQYNARSILVDHSNPFLNSIGNKAYGNLFVKNCIFNAKESNHRYSMKYSLNSYVDDIIEKTRCEVEKCDNLDGFILNTDLSGDASGITALFFEKLATEYGKSSKFNNCVFTDPCELDEKQKTYNCYNAVLSMHSILEYTDSVNLYETGKLKKLGESGLKVALNNSELKLSNQVLGKLLVDFTSSMRYTSNKSKSLNKIISYLTPYPRIHFNTVSFGYSDDEVESLTQAFKYKSNLANVEFIKGKFISSFAVFRGLFKPKKLEDYIMSKMTDRQIQFVDYNPQNHFTNSHCQVSDIFGNFSALLIQNTTNVSEIFEAYSAIFDTDYSLRKLVSEYVGDGMQEGELSEAREDVAALCKDYEEVGIETEDNASVEEY